MTPKQRPGKSQLPVFWIAIGFIAVIAIVAIVVTVTSKDTNSSGTPGSGSSGTGGTGHEYGKVTVTGTDLPPFGTGPDRAVGKTIPTVTGETFTGEQIELGPNGQAQMIVFLAHWCPHCNREAPRLASYLQSGGGTPAGTTLTIVPTGSTATAPNWPPSQWVKDMGLGDVRTVVDSQSQRIAKAYGLTSYPFIVMVDKDGKVVERRAGEQADGFFASAFAALAAGKPIPSS